MIQNNCVGKTDYMYWWQVSEKNFSSYSSFLQCFQYSTIVKKTRRWSVKKATKHIKQSKRREKEKNRKINDHRQFWEEEEEFYSHRCEEMQEIVEKLEKIQIPYQLFILDWFFPMES